MTKQNILAVGALIVVAGVIGAIELNKPEQSNIAAQEVVLDANERTIEKETLYERAKEITTPDGFINTEAFQLEDYIGKKVILVDFWTYSCINCQRTLPYLTAWDKKYRDDGLLIVGVHTPEFEFEKEYDNVKRATEKWGVTYPVVLDNDYSTWRAYKNQYWPRKYLIDIDGFIVYDHIGEGAYDETEKKIVELLNERKTVLGETGRVAVETGRPQDAQSVDFEKIRTPETYLGAARIQYLANLPATSCLSGLCSYSFSERADFAGYELMGEWKIRNEYARLESSEGAIRLAFTASKVNLVAGSDTPVRAQILVDGEEVETITVAEHDLYTLVDLDGRYENHILEIRFLDPGISAFAFTFG